MEKGMSSEREVSQKKDQVGLHTHQSQRWLTGLFLLFAISIIWSPYILPRIGPTAIIRIDQVLLPIIILFIVWVNRTELCVKTSIVTAGITLASLSVLLSVIYGFAIRGYPVSISDLYNVLIWFSYLGFVSIVSASLPTYVARRTVIVIIIATTSAAIFALLQFFDVGSVNQLISPIFTYDPHLSTLGRRLTGPAINPNMFSQLLALPLAISVVLWWRTREVLSISRYRHLLSIAISIIGTTIVLSYSRTGILTAAISLGFALVILFINDWRDSWKTMLPLVAIAIFVPTAVLLSVGVGRFDALLNIHEARSLQTRFIKWNAALPIIQEALFIGHGPSSAAKSGYSYTHVDSGLLNWWLEFGVFGVVCLYSILIGTISVCVRRIANTTLQTEEPVLWSAAIGCAGWCVAVSITWMIVSVPTNRRGWMLFLLIIICILATDNSNRY